MNNEANVTALDERLYDLGPDGVDGRQAIKRIMGWDCNTMISALASLRNRRMVVRRSDGSFVHAYRLNG